MTDFAILGASRRRPIFLVMLIAVILLTLAVSIRYATPLDGMPSQEVKRVDSDWYYEAGGSLSPLPQLPCQLNFSGSTLYLLHELSGMAPYPDDVLVIQTRYQSIRVWADETLIYEAAQGQEHALSSMWHFIPAQAYGSASLLRIELTKYDQDETWSLHSVIQEQPDAIGMYLLRSYLPSILVWLCCMLFSLLLLFIILFMAVRKIPGMPLVLALAAFIFLSGTWILLDSKITTIHGGNYALTYFFSYCVFYLLPVPLMLYFQLMLELKSRFLRCLIWIAAGNAGVWMLLHLLGVVSIQDTAVSVHLIIILFVGTFIKEFFQKGKALQRKRLVYTFLGIFLLFVTALVSIVMYHAGLLPPTNSAYIYVWGLLALVLCMIMDTVVMFGHIWKEKQYIQLYRQLATEDSMTELANRNAYELRLRELVASSPGEVSLILFDIDRMKRINDSFGHHAGDQAIAFTAQCIRDVFQGDGDCYRIGGDEFCVILTSSPDIPQKLRRFDTLVKNRGKDSIPISVSHGWETRRFPAEPPITLEDLVALKTAADKNLYLNKQRHIACP